MDAQVQAFLDKWAEKTAAKNDVLDALGKAKLADWKAEDALTPEDARPHLEESARQWAIVEARGAKSGDEGRLSNEAFAIAEAYVASHPELQAVGATFIAGEDASADEKNQKHALLVTLIAEAGKRGDHELAGKLTMLELVSFERQHIGQAIAVKTRRTNGR